jgi:hypothetical protein
MSRNFYTVEITKEEMITWVRGNFSPEDVFSHDELAIWASENSYLKSAEPHTF